MSAFVKKYIFNFRCIFLLIVSVLPALGNLLVSAVESAVQEPMAPPWYLNILEGVFRTPSIYFVALLLILFFSIDLGHCIALNIILLFSALPVIMALGWRGASEETLRFVFMLLVGFLVIVHVIAVVIKFLLIRKK